MCPACCYATILADALVALLSYGMEFKDVNDDYDDCKLIIRTTVFLFRVSVAAKSLYRFSYLRISVFVFVLALRRWRYFALPAIYLDVDFDTSTI